MARIKNGILGGIQGKIGNVEGYIRNGVACIRAEKRKSQRPPSIKQLANRQRMVLVNQFIDSMTSFIRLGFGPYSKAQQKTSSNAAKSYQLLHAVEGDYPMQKLDYPNALLSKGVLDLPIEPQLSIQESGLRVSWVSNPLANFENRMAQAIVVVYFPELQTSFYSLSGSNRYLGSTFLAMPEEYTGKVMQVYLSFVTEDRRKVSDSFYLGCHSNISQM